MKLGRYLSKSRIIDLKSTAFQEAILELVKICKISSSQQENFDIAEEITHKESTITSYLGNGVAMPYIRRDIPQPYIFAIGRCKNGLTLPNSSEHKDTHLVFLMVISYKTEDSYLAVLGAIVRILQEIENIENFISLPLSSLREQIRSLFGTCKTVTSTRQTVANKIMCREAFKIARVAKCQHFLIFGDVLTENFQLAENKFNIPVTLVSYENNSLESSTSPFTHTINVHFTSNYRLSPVRSAIIIGLARGIIGTKDRVCCLTGLTRSNVFDTISIVDVAKEFGNSFSNNENLLKEGIHPEVLERLLTIAADISIEGREGKPVGCLFVLGDTNKIKPFTKPLVLNPFYGYKEEDRNILNPFMAETIKEFSSIDGAFIVRGDGVIESAGSLIQAPNNPEIQMPSGFGTRHAAGALISSAANCIAIAVSESTNLVTIFNDGKIMLFSDQSFSSSGI